MTDITAGPISISAENGDGFDFGGFGVRWKVLVLQRVLAGERSLEWPFSRLARRSRPAV
jgi:hypothetical protein